MRGGRGDDARHRARSVLAREIAAGASPRLLTFMRHDCAPAPRHAGVDAGGCWICTGDIGAAHGSRPSSRAARWPSPRFSSPSCPVRAAQESLSGHWMTLGSTAWPTCCSCCSRSSSRRRSSRGSAQVRRRPRGKVASPSWRRFLDGPHPHRRCRHSHSRGSAQVRRRPLG